ncbi:MAG: YciI family protein [Rubrobacter sp.]|nr:YciI family protein [Rubrobacter sp.]
MRFLIMHKSNEENEAGVPPSQELIEGMSKLMEESSRAGVLIAAEGVHPSSRGARLSFSDGRRTVTDGPFAEAKELIAGFAVVQVESKDEAVEWATRFADVIGDVEIEVRQVIEMSDFVPEATVEDRTDTPSAETDPTDEGGTK